MNRNQVLPLTTLSIDPQTLERVDLTLPVAYLGNGFLTLQDLPRVAAEAHHILDGDGFECSIQTQFLKDQVVLDLTISGHLRMPCQRCLGDYEVQITDQRRFVLVSTEAEADDFPLDDDSQEPLVASPNTDLLATIEDEILLALPSAPKHPESVCQLDPSAKASEPESPFKVLKNMKKKN
jgi:uncharacterized protein